MTGRRQQSRSERDRARRMKWWHEARFGMFLHWGLYSQLARHEWVMNLERIPLEEYEKLADSWKPKPDFAREWAALAKKAGMKYMVLSTKHLEGFCLWDTQQTDYNAAKRGPGRDLVREYVEACREFGLRIGFYYCITDWHHPEAARSAKNATSRRRFLDFTQGCVRELMSNYGKIDILWYDADWHIATPEVWECRQMNDMVRALQPDIIVNDRSGLPGDFSISEGHITPEAGGRPWEACITFDGSWCWRPSPPEDWHSVRSVLSMLRTCTAGGGNLLLNVGPKPDGSLPEEAHERLKAVGRWLSKHPQPVYGKVDPASSMLVMPTGAWTRKGRTLYYWVTHWPGTELTIGGLQGKLKSAKLLDRDKSLHFVQTKDRLLLSGLPRACPDKVAGVAVIELQFARVPSHSLGPGCVFYEQHCDLLKSQR